MKWYYFARSGNDLRIQLHAPRSQRIPPRPSDANPANGDPLTPYYIDEDHMDESHVHVRASSVEDARVRALDLVASVYKRELAGVNLG